MTHTHSSTTKNQQPSSSSSSKSIINQFKNNKTKNHKQKLKKGEKTAATVGACITGITTAEGNPRKCKRITLISKHIYIYDISKHYIYITFVCFCITFHGFPLN
jgi:hypothetical protein